MSTSLRPSLLRTRSRLSRVASGVGTAALALALPALGVSGATAQAAPTTAPATPRAASFTQHATVVSTGSTRLTAEARRAGLEPGNARMGWRQSSVAEQNAQLASTLRMAAKTSTKAYAPTGVLGIDVSSYQRTISWSGWKAKGRSFAFIKATEGMSYRNPYFAAQSAGSAKVGMLRGAYHFASPSGKAGYLQARFFVAHGGAWTAKGGQTLPGVLDIEYNPYGSTCYGLSKTKMVAWVKSFTTEYKKLTGKDAIIYTTTDWWTRCTGNSAAFTTTNPLWAARYGTTTPGTLPGAWKTATFWQYTSTPIDQDRFSNTYARLKVLATVS